MQRLKSRKRLGTRPRKRIRGRQGSAYRPPSCPEVSDPTFQEPSCPAERPQARTRAPRGAGHRDRLRQGAGGSAAPSPEQRLENTVPAQPRTLLRVLAFSFSALPRATGPPERKQRPTQRRRTTGHRSSRRPSRTARGRERGGARDHESPLRKVLKPERAFAISHLCTKKPSRETLGSASRAGAERSELLTPAPQTPGGDGRGRDTPGAFGFVQ